ncbi:uncharacterized protein [Apostichopus japonicus]|uniref:uncharacterized protein n=1 Tax=Stichopus japonicus TaxID=307972 RepID=UPI003AB2CDFC
MGGDEEVTQVHVQETTIRSRLFNVFEITLLFGAAAVGGVAAVTVALVKADFEGDCPLFAEVTYTNIVYFRIDVNPSSFECDYCIILQVFLAMSALLLIMLRIIVICTRLVSPAMRQWVRLIIMIPFFVITSFAVLLQAAIITAGLNTFCRGLLDGAVDEMRCWMFQPIDWSIYDGFRFYDRLFKGMIASWSSFLIWAILTTSSCLVALSSKKPPNQRRRQQ